MYPPRVPHLAAFLLLCSNLATSNALQVIQNDDSVLELQNSTVSDLEARSNCAVTCGYYGQLCCPAGSSCTVDANNEAQCGGGSGAAASPSSGGYWQMYTTTYVQTETDLTTLVSTYSSFIPQSYTPVYPTTPGSTATAAAAQCDYAQGEQTCGNICCPNGQYCVVAGQCAKPSSSMSSSMPSSVTPAPPLRPTSSGMSTVVTTYPTTTTVPFSAPMETGQVNITSTSSDSGGLSAGAIAGIVLGVLFGLLLLFLLIAFLCCRAVWDGLLAVFGLGRHRRTRTEVIEESYRHTSRSGRDRDDRRSWYGDRPSRVERSSQARGNKRSNFAWAAPLTAGFGGFATAIGLGKRRETRRTVVRDEKSDYSSDYYSTEYTASSSDRRTRDTRRSTRR